ncbi:MAG: ACP S-malonyltransferase [Bacilli bacterium]|nr:ACP S-malonyltransferase [Bacilli bacterium]MBN2877239.1 ACP S-malonyltransferase [Bacilli bacterium]
MRVAFMFSGQGAQYVGMGEQLYESYGSVRDIFEHAKHVLGYDIKHILFQDEQKLNDTKYTQVAMFVLYASILEVLREHGIDADYSFGLSLGEYGAYLHNQVFSFETGLRIIQSRGEFMNLAASKNPGKMSAIMGMDVDTLEHLVNQVPGTVKIANYNTYGQLVISGDVDAVDALNQLAKDQGAKRVIPLNTSGAFHSPLMSQAADDFEHFLDGIDLSEPRRNLVVNFTGDYYKENLKEIMALQITSSVRFIQSVERLIADGVDTFIEIGPKKTLSGFVRKINKDVTIGNVEDLESLQATLSILEG